VLAVYSCCVHRHFLRGEVIAFADFQRYGGDKLKLMIDGKLKTETKKYIVNDGDIIEYFVKKS
jgi:ribosome-binding ATPase YchF (GTP1/OBG family)